jgi:hypothetical protein
MLIIYGSESESGDILPSEKNSTRPVVRFTSSLQQRMTNSPKLRISQLIPFNDIIAQVHDFELSHDRIPVIFKESVFFEQ